MESTGLSGVRPPSAIRSFPLASGRIAELDGLRGVAILLVIICHYFVGTTAPQRGTWLFYLKVPGRLAWSGVDLFFVLSGFLIGGILLDARTSSRYFQVFYRRRFCRIVPIYAAMCLLWWIALRPVFVRQFGVLGEVFPRPASWWLYLTYVQNFWMASAGTLGTGWAVVTWSLAVEEQFYLMLPAVVKYVEERQLVYVLGFAIAFAPCLRILLFRLLPASQGAVAAFTLMPCRADALLLGALAALLVRRQSAWTYLVTHQRYLVGVFVILLGGVLYLTVKAPLQSGWPMVSFGYTWLGLCYVCLLLIAISGPGGFLGRVLRGRLLVWLGSVSYGAYLIHTVVLGLAFGFLRHHSPKIANVADLMVVLFALCLTMTIAQLSWTFFEKPIVKYGHAVGY